MTKMLAQSIDEWRKRALKEVNKTNISELSFASNEGIEIKPLYTSLDNQNSEESLPGIFPFRRGVYASMYKNRPWTIRQYAGFSSARASNAFYKRCLKSGQRGLSVAFDLPTHRGYDSDDETVAGDVGKAGVAIDSVLDMKTLFSGIDLSQVSVSMTMNGAVLPILAAFIVNAEENGINKNQISGTIQNDILKEFMVRNTFIYPPKASMRIVADVIEYCAAHLPKFNSVSISGYHIHEAGADLGLELGLTIADGIEYVKAALKRGIALDDFAPRLSFFFAMGMNFFMEVAKLRAARVLWAQVMKDMGARDEKSMLLRTHVQTSGWSLQAKDPYNNIMRTTIEALAAVLGGTQSLHTNSFDEALALPTENSARIARNTQLILQHECQLNQVIDPLGGSYYVEYLTNELMKKAREIIEQVKTHGGMAQAISDGLPIRWIEEASLRRQALIDSGKEVIVGVNKYQAEHEEELDILSIDNEEVIKEQKISLLELRKNRNQAKVDAALKAVSLGARSEENLLALSIEAMRARATVGELSKALEEVFGRFKPPVSMASGVYAKMNSHSAGLKKIIEKCALFAQNYGRQPRILIAKMGQDGHDRGAKVIASAFADMGFDVDLSPLFQSPKSVAQQAVDNDVHAIGISTLAAAHNSLIPELVNELKLRHAENIILIVGGVVPPQDHKSLLEMGVSLIFGPGTNIVAAAELVLEMIKKRSDSCGKA
jgi:methylmalonyl-CoA mutase